MKKIFYILLLITGIMDAQIVYIPDANFKAKLLSASPTVYVGSTVNPDSSATPNVYTTIDVNGNGEIEVSEAQNIIYLKLNWVSGFGAKISNLQGIEAFTNLKTLYCAYNSLSTLDLTSNINLDYVGCWNNLLASVNVSSCINLKTLSCSYNNLSSVDLSGNPNLSDLIIGNNQLTSLNVDVNQYLSNITANSNNLTSINVFNKNLLTTLNVGYNQITNINLVNLPHLYKVNVQNNLITALDLSTVAFQTYFNNISNPSMYEISLNNNLDLIYINLKNGFTNSNISLSSLNVNNQIQYICKDNNDVFSSANYNSNSLVSSYCNFTPGGYYNTITGSIQFDADNNGCDASDLPQPNIKININDGTASGATFTNNQGNYNFYTQAGSFVLTPDIENPTWFTFSLTTATIPFADNNSNTTTQNFCIAANGVHNDVEVVVEPIMFARPGFDATYKIVYKNKGNQTLSGDVSLSYDDSVLDFISATVAPNSQSTGVMNWNYTGLLPFENRSFYVTFNVNAPTATPPVNIGDVLSFNASITPVITDENPLDNSFAYNQTVVGSFDPNDITCLEGETVPPSSIGSYLHYGVNFENTGTYPAENIVVKVVIDTAKYDVNSLQLLNTSNPAYTKITGNVVEFIFKNIMLDTGGHGNVLFKIKSNPTLVVGDAVTNRADIFFDYNFPIDTGMANTVFQALSNTDFEIDNFVLVAPNPASNELTIKAEHSIKTIQLYDAQGRVILISLVNAPEFKLDVSSYSKGIYFIKITTDKGIKVQKLQKD